MINKRWEPLDTKQFWEDRNNGMSRTDLCNKYGATLQQLKHFLYVINDSCVRVKKDKVNNLPEEIEETGNTRKHTIVTDKEVRSLGDLLELYKVDTTVWKVKSWKCGVWNGFYKDKNTQTAHTKQLYKCEATFEILQTKIDIYADIKLSIEDMKQYAPTYPRIQRYNPMGDHALCLDIPDLHMGKLAWGEETGCSNYDSSIAEGLFFDCLSDFLTFAKNYNIAEIVFPIGNDILNCDNSENTTTHKTPQSADTRHKKTYQRTRRMLVTALEAMRELAPVKALVIPGNHDSDTCFYIGDSLQGWMSKCDDVEIDNNAFHMKTYQFGNTGVLFTHGTEKEKDLALTFATDYPELWMSTKFHEVHLGHLHTTKVIDYRGCLVRYLSSLSSSDYWHSIHNYKSRRSASAFLWSRDGQSSIHRTWNAPVEKVLG